MKHDQWFEQNGNKVVELHFKNSDSSVWADVETLYRMFRNRMIVEQNEELSKMLSQSKVQSDE